MKKYLLLTKVLFKCGSGASMESASGGKRMKKLSEPLLAVIMLACFIPVMQLIFSASKQMYALLSPVGMQDSLIFLATMVGAVITFVFGISMVITYFYTTSDLPILLAMPLRPSCIVAAKGTLCLAYEYLMVIMFTGPMLAGYGTASGAGAVYWIGFVFVCLLLPVIPLAYGAIISMIFMRLFRGVRNKQTLTVVSMVVALVIAIGSSMLSQNISSMDASAIQDISKNASGLKFVFPQLILANEALSLSSPLYLLCFIASVAATIAVFLLLADMLYFQGAIGMTEAAQKERKLSRRQFGSIVRKRKPAAAYAKVEMKKVLRSPTYFMNGVLIDFIWPLFFLIPFIPGLVNGGKETSGSLSAVFGFMTGAAGKESSFAVMVLILYGVIFFVSVFNFMTPSTISREGKAIWFMKTIPMSYRDQLHAKIRSSIAFTFLPSAIYCLIMCVVAVVSGMSPLIFLYFAVLSVPIIALVNYVQLLFDLRWPKLIWQNEAVPIKQNFHAMAATGVSLLLGCLPAAAGAALYLLLHVNIHIAVWIVFAILAILAFAFRFWVNEYGTKRMKELS